MRMAHVGENLVDYVIIAVGILALALTALALGAWRRTGDRRLLFVAAAFGIVVIKQVMTVYSIAYETIGHQDLEMYNSVLDLGVMGALVAPFIWRRP